MSVFPRFIKGEKEISRQLRKGSDGVIKAYKYNAGLLGEVFQKGCNKKTTLDATSLKMTAADCHILVR